MERDHERYEEQEHAIKTWRYLRLGMVAMVVGLAGVFAPVVAFVPTSDPDSCKSVKGSLVNPDPIVDNNVTALLSVGLLGLIILAGLAGLAWLGRRRRPTNTALVGYALTWVVWIVATGVFINDPDWVVVHAHDYAAIAMFACIFVVVCLNALGFKLKTSARTPGNRYALVAGAMVLAAIGSLAFGGEYRVIAIEGSLIALFAVFWVVQTWELWDVGLRDVSENVVSGGEARAVGP